MNRRIYRLFCGTTMACTIAILLFLLPMPPSVRAGGTVTNCADDTDFSSKLGGGGTVTFSCGTATVTLSSTKTITQNTTIDGGNVITLSGAGILRLFVVNSGATLSLTNITIRDGNSGANDGGAIYVNIGGMLTIVGSKFYSNTTGSTQGGGAITTFGALNISNSEFAYNKAGGGGALNTVFGGAVSVITNSNFHDNQTLSNSGGAIYIRDAAPMTLTQVTLSNNKALSQGGGILVAGAGSSLIISNSQILSNTAQSAGGGIYSQGALNVISSTLSHNNADSVGGGLVVESTAWFSATRVYSNTSFSGGGGLNSTATASLTLINSTIDANYTYAGDGGGIRSLGTLVLTDTFVTNNLADPGPGDTYGGGIFHQTGSLNVIGNVSSNRAKHGAAINLNSGAGAIRSAFIAFNHAVGGDGGALRIAGGSMSLDGSTIFGNTADNNGGGINNQGTLTLTQTSVSINHAPYNGGGIFQSSGTTTFISSTIDSNDTPGFGTGSGGGIYISGGTITMRNSKVDHNAANYRGGGILNFATLTLDSSLVNNNISYGGDSSLDTYGGGGIYNFGNATVLSSTLRNNSTTAQDGGGFYNGWYANATLNSVTLSNNRAAQDGGGFKNNLGIATLTNVTFYSNTAHADGGGVYSDHGQTNLQHVTFSGNSANNGGGIYNLTVYTTRTVSLQNTIITNSTSGYNCVSDFPGSLNVVSQGYNLSDDGSFAVAGHCPSAFAGTDQNNTNAKLGALANNGGPTTGPNLEPMLTHLPLPGSPAIDLILPGTNGCNTVFRNDQRGITRPQDGDGNGGFACDIGAVEYRVGDLYPRLYLPLILR